MQLVEKHIVKLNNINYEMFDKLTRLSKNLYNAGLYNTRQHFFATEKHKSWDKIEKEFISTDNIDYRALPSKVAKEIMRSMGQDFNSFFGLLEKKKQGLYDEKINIPHYKDKNGKHLIKFEKQTISKQVVELPNNLFEHTLCKRELNIKIISKQPNIDYVRILPRYKHFVVEIIYTKQEQRQPKIKQKDRKIATIDPGIRNLLTITFNDGRKPVIIKGGPIKSINQYYNKQRAYLQSKLPNDVYTSNKVNQLTTKRNRKLEWTFHNISKNIVNFLVQNEVDTLVIGKNINWKQNVNLGKKNNQNFVMIPFNKLYKQLEYKCELIGIKVKYQEESYTSKANCLNFDKIPIYGKNDENYKFTGKRNRGLYKSDCGKIINSDVNGSYNIGRKAFPKLYIKDGIEDVAGHPTLMNFLKCS